MTSWAGGSTPWSPTPARRACTRWAQVAAAITAPTLVIAGGASSLVPQEHVADLVHALAHGRMVTIEAGHLVHGREPEAFIDAVQEFLDLRGADT